MILIPGSVACHRKPHSCNMTQQETSPDHKLDIIPENSTTINPTVSKTTRIQRAQWLRAAILGANDGLLSTATLMLGVSSAVKDRENMILSGVAGAVAGTFSMALGEFVSVSTQKEIEEEACRVQKGNKSENNDQVQSVLREHGTVETQSPGRPPMMRAIMMNKTISGEEREVLPNPMKAALASGLAFLVGSVLPLASSAFIDRYEVRNLVLVVVTSVALVIFGGLAARIGGSPRVGLSAARVLIGGWLAMGVAYWLLKLLDKDKDDS